MPDQNYKEMYGNNSRYYGIADTLCGPKRAFVSLYSRYNGHLGRIEMTYYSICQRKYFEDRMFPQITTLFFIRVQSTLFKNKETILLCEI